MASTATIFKGLTLVQILPETSPGAVAVRSLPDLQTEPVLRSILQSIDHGVLLTDLEHRSLACNPRFGEIFGVDPFDVVSIDVEELRDRVAPFIVDVEGWRASLEDIYADPSLRYEDEIVLLRGAETVLRRVSTPVYDARGKIFGRLWTFSDVTEARQRRRNAEMLRSISMLSDPDPAVNLRRICEAVTNHFGAASQINILEGDFLRFHFNAGDLGPAAALPGIHKWDTYCGYTLVDDDTLLVQDARKDPRCAGLLPASVGFCRYLGVPVRDETGRAIGTLCIIDQQMDRPLGPADVELMEMIAMRTNAELIRERYLAERIAEKDRLFETKRLELEETRTVLGTMNDAFSLLFETGDTSELLREQACLLRDVLGYAASAVFLRRPGEPQYDVSAWAHGADGPQNFATDLGDYPSLDSCATGGTSLDVDFIEVEGDAIGRLLSLPWAAVACLPKGEWGEAVVVLGSVEEPPRTDPRHLVQLSAVMDGVRLVLAAHALNAGIVQANHALVGAQEKALRSEKLAVVGTLAASTAHDIRNITASLSMLAAEQSDPVASLAAVREQLDRFNVLAHRLLSYARPGQVERRPIDLPELLDRVLSLTAGQMRVSRVKALLECEADLPVILGDANQLQHLLVNVTLNAVQAMERTGGRLRLEARAAGKGVEVRIVDDGPGIPESVRDRLFQPFASSRAQGFGLGLFSAKRIAEAHGGAIAALANEDRGTTILVELPAGGSDSE